MVTGAARGLGRAIAVGMAREGAAVMCIDIDEDGALATAAIIEEAGGQALALAADVAESEPVARAVEAAVTTFGGLDIVINNAVYARYGPLAELESATIDRMLAVGVKGVLLTARAAAPHLARGGHGAIINLSSVVGLRGIAYSSAYAAMKGAVNGLTAALAVELGQSGIRVNAIAPSAIPSDMSNSVLDEQGWEERRRRTALQKIGREADVVEAVIYLSGDSGGFISGVVLPVDGGFTAAGLIPGVDLSRVQSTRQPGGESNRTGARKAGGA